MYELFYNLEKYWKKYQYATKFVQLVKSKTPKVTLYTKFAKCMLMENSPNADLEMCFYDGGYCRYFYHYNHSYFCLYQWHACTYTFINMSEM